MFLDRRGVALRFSAVALAMVLDVCLAHNCVFAADTDIFNPATAPVIRITIKVIRQAKASPVTPSTDVTSKTIDKLPGAVGLNDVIKQTTAGAASSANGELHIRGSHGQYSTYLDYAPLPANVSGSFSDLINPKDIELLRIYTGGFPAEYGGQMAAIFDVTAKVGQQGAPSGFIQDYIGNYDTNQRVGQVGGSEKNLSYFLSINRTDTDFKLSPLSETPLHNDGSDGLLFGKFDYLLGKHDKLTLDTAQSTSQTQIPNDPTRAALNQNDYQVENGNFLNLIWRHLDGGTQAHVAYYSHDSHLQYFGSPADLLPTPGTTSYDGLIETNEDQTADYKGVRADYGWTAGAHQPKVGFDVNTVTGREDFSLVSPPSTGFAPITDNATITGGDSTVFAQDDWKLNRLLANYGLRYDQHRADITTSQVSPRLNLGYAAGRNDQFNACYDRLFQPAAVEDVRSLTGESAIGSSGALIPFQPERDDFYEAGWDHKIGRHKMTLDTYYRIETNAVDDSILGNTQIDVPVNFAKGYARGVELTFDGPLAKNVTYYANYARSWAKEQGPISGGLLGGAAPDSWFYDDHDQLHTATFGVEYNRQGRYVSLSGDYGSGYPYGQQNNAAGQPVAINYIFVPPHISLDFACGMPIPNGSIDFSSTNILNHPYVLTEASPFADVQWAQGRTIGVKVTQNF